MIHHDIISVIASFLPLQQMMKLERVCKEWKLGLYLHCSSVKSFQLTKHLLYLIQVPIPRPLISDKQARNALREYCYSNEKTLFNNQAFIAPKDQNHRLTIRKMVSKWFGEMFVHVEKLHFSDVRFSGDLVDDFFSSRVFCEKIRQLTFVGCHLMKSCAKEFTNKMKNVECIIYYKNKLEDVDLKHLTEFVKSSSLKYLYYPQADLVNLSKLTEKDKLSPFYYELDDEFKGEDGEDAKHQVTIFDIEKTKQFHKTKGNFHETLKMFGIISNEFEEFYYKTLELPANECISQFNRLIDNGMHFFDVNFKNDFVMELFYNHWRHFNVIDFFQNYFNLKRHKTEVLQKLLANSKSTEEQFEIVQQFWPRCSTTIEKISLLQISRMNNVLEQLIEEKIVEIDWKEFENEIDFCGVLKIVKQCLRKRKTMENKLSPANKKAKQ
ncbi:predicted protein [Naegleria gruberi]|uniref:Predicted protein n=1 Tax=Naegleria gruberi TaxID=5762 RepID=D2VWC3_NAEGR|nr:uncharacterized protein NAEGRDRAFT_52778 [Naegleria gruberi]EFC38809.1 predicted protein [Naegleria gruberi]|eukprot:XP_002671553.1 predicted protein [Naegleria gruberi strain NEG-M]